MAENSTPSPGADKRNIYGVKDQGDIEEKKESPPSLGGQPEKRFSLEIVKMDPSENKGEKNEATQKGPFFGLPAKPPGPRVSLPRKIDDSQSLTASFFNKKALYVALTVILALALMGGSFFVYQKLIGRKKTEPVSSQSSQPSLISPLSNMTIETPTPTPAPVIKKEELKIQILNGSGVVGEAGRAQKLLEGLGYQGIKTGNADSYDYEKTEVSIKKSKQAYLKVLTKDLAEEYTLAAETKALNEESEFDVVVVLGKE